MCDRPLMLDNPRFGMKRIGINRYYDCTSLKIPVPCGNCPTCIALRQEYFVQRAQMESLDRYLFMCTLTYKDSMIRHIDVNGRKLKYADWSDVQNMFKRIRNAGYKDFRYFCVSEYGGERHRPHFHFLLSLPRCPTDKFNDIMNLEKHWYDLILSEWRRKIGGSKRSPVYAKLCDLIITPNGRTYDFHYVNPSLTNNGDADVSFYTTKYVLKSSKWLDKLKSALKLNLSPDVFIEVWKLLKPKCCVSKSWGNYSSPLVRQHIRKGIDFSKRDKDAKFPYFINPVTGQTFPLSPLYQKKFFTVNDKEYFYLKGDDKYLDSIVQSQDLDPKKSAMNDRRFDKIKSAVDSRENSFDYVYKNSSFSQEALQEVSCISDCDFTLYDDWQSDFGDSF